MRRVRFFKFLFYLFLALAVLYMVVFQRDWIQRNIINRIEGVYYVYKGDRAYKKHKLSYAIDYYKKGLELFDGHYTAWCNLGNIYVVYEDYYAAVDAYENAIKHNDKYVVARMNLGIIQAERLGNFDAAIEQYEGILSRKYFIISFPPIYSNKRSSKTNRGLAYYNMGRAYRQKALFLTDENRGMTNTYLLKSAEAYEKASKILKKNADVRYNLALDYHLLGNYRDAGKNYCRAIQLCPMSYETHYNYAILLRRLRYYKASLEELEKASLLVSTAKSDVNSQYIFGILSDVSRSMIDFREDPHYVEHYEADDQGVDFFAENKMKFKKKKNKKKGDKPIEEDPIYINEAGKIVPSAEIDSLFEKSMSECAGASYFKDDYHDY